VRNGDLRARRRGEDDDEDFARPVAARPWWWRILLRRPRDTLAFVIAAAAVVAVIVNGAYLQHGRHPAPMFAVRPLPVAAAQPSDVVGVLAQSRPIEPEAAKHESGAARPQPVVVELPRPRPAAPATVAAHKDPIAELIASHPVQFRPLPPAPPAPPAPVPVPPPRSLAQPSRQVLAVQHALSEFGYGQLKPTGVYDDPTRQAIQRFEREHKLPVTGEISDEVKRELVALTGRALD
jgi:hypothetical protein